MARGRAFVCTVAATWRSRGKKRRFPGDVRRRAGEKTRAEKETNVNNKPGDGGKPKHTEIARTQEMKSSRRPKGRGLAPGGRGLRLQRFIQTRRKRCSRSLKLFNSGWQEARGYYFNCCEFEELPGSTLITRSSCPSVLELCRSLAPCTK